MSQEFAYILKTLLEESRLKDYPAMEADKYFEIFAAQQALKAKKFNPDKDEIESGVIGGDGDGGVDGFYVSVNRRIVREDTDPLIFKGQQAHIEVIIVQARNKASFEEVVPTKFKDFGRSSYKTQPRLLCIDVCDRRRSEICSTKTTQNRCYRYDTANRYVTAIVLCLGQQRIPNPRGRRQSGQRP